MYNEISIREKQEQMYLALAVLAINLYNAGKTMKCSEVVDWINRNFYFPHPYVSVRGVFQASYRRVDENHQEALASVFTNQYGVPLV